MGGADRGQSAVSSCGGSGARFSAVAAPQRRLPRGAPGTGNAAGSELGAASIWGPRAAPEKGCGRGPEAAVASVRGGGGAVGAVGARAWQLRCGTGRAAEAAAARREERGGALRGGRTGTGGRAGGKGREQGRTEQGWGRPGRTLRATLGADKVGSGRPRAPPRSREHPGPAAPHGGAGRGGPGPGGTAGPHWPTLSFPAIGSSPREIISTVAPHWLRKPALDWLAWRGRASLAQGWQCRYRHSQ